MAKKGKNYRAALEKIDRNTLYGAKAAFELLKDVNKLKYDPTVDLVLRLGVDPRKADQMVRGAVSLPHGTGKTMTVAVVTSGEKIEQARAAGADFVGGDDLVAELENLLDQLDAVVASPDMMGKLGRLGKVLGPRGLMPAPKSGTVTMDVAKAVTEIKAGRVDYRTDRQGNVHTVIGKLGFTVDQLVENYTAVLEEIQRVRPSAAKGRYMRNVAISTTASPSVRLDPAKTLDEL